MRVLVKIGGAQLEEPDARSEFAQSVKAAVEAGHGVVCVHGGGGQIRALARELGLEERKVDGLRVTDEPTARVVLQVLGGEVNRTLVAALSAAGVAAAGLTGVDGGLFDAVKHEPDGRDLGFVGAVATVRPALANTLLESGTTPVIATVSKSPADPLGPFYNINADQAAAPLSAAFDADAVLFLTDVAGVLDAEGNVFSDLAEVHCKGLRREGVLAGGMLPKVDAALAAAAANPAALVKVAPAAGPNCVLVALESGVGTRFRAEEIVRG